MLEVNALASGHELERHLAIEVKMPEITQQPDVLPFADTGQKRIEQRNPFHFAPDLRGFGRSAAPAEGYTKAAMARDVHALMQQLGHRRIKLAGHISA